MKIAGLVSLILLSSLQKTSAWGFWGHRAINRMACFTLPPQLFVFYKTHIDYLTEHAVDPDKRRYSDPAEAPRHFIDLDHYPHPDSVPVYWKDAVEKFTEDSLVKYGIVPWHINKMYYGLVKAFAEKDESRILYYSANLGHYIADSHVPLHCTENYNGQMTNQSGIHGFWESRLPELFGDDYDFAVGRASYIDNIQEFCWENVRASFAALDSVLSFERVLTDRFDSDRKFSFELRGSQLIRVYSKEFSTAFHEELDGQVERRMQAAIVAVGSIWYTAWVNAGMPEVSPGEIQSESETESVEMNTDSTKKYMKERACE